MFAISASRPCRTPAFTTRRRSSVEMSSANISAMASQSRAAKCAKKRSMHLACRVFQPRRRPAELVEPRERGVDVCLVEQFDAVDQVAIDGGKDDLSPLGFEAVLRGPADRLGEDRSEVAQLMHSLDVDDDVRCEVPRGTHVCGQVAGRERSRSPVIDVHPVRHQLGHFAPVGCGKGLRDDRPRVRVGGRFAGEVPGVELLEGGVDVVEVEQRRPPRSGCRRRSR